MKKILFATTAIVATASVAAADVSFSGYGRFGVVHDGATDTNNTYSRFRLQMDVSTEADNGLSFGARLRHEEDTLGGGITSTPNGFNSARFWAKVGGFEVGFGNTTGAIEAMPGVYAATQSAGNGVSGLGYLSQLAAGNVNGLGGWDAYSSKGAGAAAGEGVEVSYAAGDFGGHLSYSNGGGRERTAIHVRYTFNGWTAALGYQDSSVVGETMTLLTVKGKVGNFGIDVGAATFDGAPENKYVLRGYYDIGAATTLNGYIANQKGAGTEDNAFGLGVSHSLGGGASVEAGVVRDFAGNTNADLGVRFNF
jgi:outer membrane protein OmpU